MLTPWAQDVDWTYIGRSERLMYIQFTFCVQGVFFPIMLKKRSEAATRGIL